MLQCSCLQILHTVTINLVHKTRVCKKCSFILLQLSTYSIWNLIPLEGRKCNFSQFGGKLNMSSFKADISTFLPAFSQEWHHSPGSLVQHLRDGPGWKKGIHSLGPNFEVEKHLLSKCDAPGLSRRASIIYLRDGSSPVGFSSAESTCSPAPSSGKATAGFFLLWFLYPWSPHV